MINVCISLRTKQGNLKLEVLQWTVLPTSSLSTSIHRHTEQCINCRLQPWTIFRQQVFQQP